MAATFGALWRRAADARGGRAGAHAARCRMPHGPSRGAKPAGLGRRELRHGRPPFAAAPGRRARGMRGCARPRPQACAWRWPRRRGSGDSGGRPRRWRERRRRRGRGPRPAADGQRPGERGGGGAAAVRRLVLAAPRAAPHQSTRLRGVPGRCLPREHARPDRTAPRCSLLPRCLSHAPWPHRSARQTMCRTAALGRRWVASTSPCLGRA